MTTESTMYERNLVALTRERLRRAAPTLQAELIAGHYARNALLALQLMAAINNRPYGGDPTGVIAHMHEQLKKNHLHDLGIALEWLEEPR